MNYNADQASIAIAAKDKKSSDKKVRPKHDQTT